ncbi:MAG: hypothetical protein EZS28_016414 [Streblomastix strix]|uniref:Uncharacterized protein n=1 Tax=Streblomastix strix TaxID=222440 RepID=A0A5J4W0B3_9EUKA|nr:MAG: hypothetical protein EZS28_016414 [Streblomastix strix]
MRLENLRLRRRYSDPELSSTNTITRNTTSNEDSTRIWLDNRNEQESGQPFADSRVLGLAVEHQINGNVYDNFPKDMSVQSNQDIWWNQPKERKAQKHETQHRKQLEEAGTSGLNLIRARYQTQLGGLTSQPAINHCASQTKQMDNDPSRCFELRIRGIADKREPRECVRTWKLEGQQPQEFQINEK